MDTKGQVGGQSRADSVKGEAYAGIPVSAASTTDACLYSSVNVAHSSRESSSYRYDQGAASRNIVFQATSVHVGGRPSPVNKLPRSTTKQESRRTPQAEGTKRFTMSEIKLKNTDHWSDKRKVIFKRMARMNSLVSGYMSHHPT